MLEKTDNFLSKGNEFIAKHSELFIGFMIGLIVCNFWVAVLG